MIKYSVTRFINIKETEEEDDFGDYDINYKNIMTIDVDVKLEDEKRIKTNKAFLDEVDTFVNRISKIVAFADNEEIYITKMDEDV